MSKAVGVAFRPGGKAYMYDPEDLALVIGDEVVVPAQRGVEFGTVASAVRKAAPDEFLEPLKKVMRRATARDQQRREENIHRKEEAFRTCRKMIQKHKLPMKLVDVDYVFDGSSIVFYFTAEGRVDFRELVKDLASTLRARIELRQVGVRDEAKMVGGLGPCGRDLCCSLFLSDFNPVSIKMAKEQDLPLNPSKISGICGRLMCCLKYEVEAYAEFNETAPPYGTEVELEEGVGRIVGYQIPCRRVVVEMENGAKVPVALDDVLERRQSRGKKSRKKKKPSSEQQEAKPAPEEPEKA